MVARAVCEVDLDAISANVEVLRSHARGSALLSVVKADGYGHGLLPVARASQAGGADWLGTALLSEALTLRLSGIRGPILGWLWSPGDDDLAACIAHDIDISASSVEQLDEIAAAAAGLRARVHLKIDTGLGRSGAPAAQWPQLVAHAIGLQAAGAVEVIGIWSHFVLADAPSSPVTADQLGAFDKAIEVAEASGLSPRLRHIANSAATLVTPAAHYDMVRPGIAVYGISPGGELGPPQQYGLIPAMTLRARLALVKRVPAGQGVSYGHLYTTSEPTTLGLVPLGYADGIPRSVTNRAPVLAAGLTRRIAGRVCMDQFVLDLGDDPARAGDEVVLFGDPARGHPPVEDWAVAADTIGYEIVTRLGPRIPRVYLGGQG